MRLMPIVALVAPLAFDAMQDTRATSTASVSPFRGGIFLCWIALRILPAKLVLLVSPSSFLTSLWDLGPCLGCSSFVLI